MQNTHPGKKNRPRAGSVWTQAEQNELLKNFEAGCSPQEMADLHGRTVAAIVGKLQQFNLLAHYGIAYYRVSPDPWVLLPEIRQAEYLEAEEGPPHVQT